MAKKNKQPWPTKNAMTQIYEKHLWGGEDSDFYSGTGSHDPKITMPYLNAVVGFLNSLDDPVTVCDLGCGDFNIGKHLVPHTKAYIAIDIVESLIDRNKTLFKEKHLTFLCLDVAKAELPAADCIILRQVLQHLSNAEILRIVGKLTDYQYIILTEHLPVGDFIPNKAIISGQGIRLKQHSGVVISAPPFNFKAKRQTVLDTHVLEGEKGQIVTTLLEVF